jgi:hypothetical protein
MSQLLMLKSLGRKDIINQVRKVEKYQDNKGCAITTEVHDNGILVYDASNSEFLLNIQL